MDSAKSAGQPLRKVKPDARNRGSENGSVLVVVLIILLLLTLAGISATGMSTTESYIVRNTAIHKQNLQLADMAASAGAQRILRSEDDNETLDWHFDIDDDPASGFQLIDLPPGDKIHSNVAVYTDSRILEQRGEENKETLWYYFVGWDSTGTAIGDEVEDYKSGKVVGVYNSEVFGRAAVEVGVEKLVAD